MPTITDVSPADVAAELAALDAAWVAMSPTKSPQNLLIGTWNIRDFDKITMQWRSGPGASPIRDMSNVLAIASIVRRFDVMAIQEVRVRARKASSR